MSYKTTYNMLMKRLNEARLTAKELAEKGLLDVTQVNECRKTLDIIESFILDTYNSYNPNGFEANEKRLARLESELANKPLKLSL